MEDVPQDEAVIHAHETSISANEKPPIAVKPHHRANHNPDDHRQDQNRDADECSHQICIKVDDSLNTTDAGGGNSDGRIGVSVVCCDPQLEFQHDVNFPNSLKAVIEVFAVALADISQKGENKDHEGRRSAIDIQQRSA